MIEKCHRFQIYIDRSKVTADCPAFNHKTTPLPSRFMPSACCGWMYAESLGHAGEELICRARQNAARRGQTVKGLNAIHLLTCSRCAWLMSSSFGGEHMSTAAVPPWIGSDCVLANCIPGSQAKSEWSELSHFWCERLPDSTWFTCLSFRGASGRSLRPRQRPTWKICFFVFFFRRNTLKRWSWGAFRMKRYETCDFEQVCCCLFPATQFSGATVQFLVWPLFSWWMVKVWYMQCPVKKGYFCLAHVKADSSCTSININICIFFLCSRESFVQTISTELQHSHDLMTSNSCMTVIRAIIVFSYGSRPLYSKLKHL